MKVYNHGCPRVKLKKNKQKSRWDFLVSFLCFQTFRKLTQSTILKCWAAVSRSWVCPWITAIKFTTRDISPYMTHFMRGWNVSQHPAEIWPLALVLGKHCLSAKEENTGFCPARTQTLALAQCSWTTAGTPSDRKAKGFVSLWLISLNNHVFIHHSYFWWGIIMYYLPTKA